LVIEITQTFRLAPERGRLRGGCTLLVDLAKKEVRYFVRKRVESEQRLKTQLGMAISSGSGLRATYFDDPQAQAEPFAMLHGFRA
jgi:hypothetical protein